MFEPTNDRIKLDPYVASSLLQKSIRRGDVDLAIYAARYLEGHRGKAVWRRLVTIAFEDVGLAQISLLHDVTRQAASTNPGSAADGQLQWACRVLAEAPKSRSADNLFSIQMEYQQRALDGEWNTAALVISCTSDPDRALGERAAALLAPWTAGVPDSSSIMQARLRDVEPFLPLRCADIARTSARAFSLVKHSFVMLLPLLVAAQMEDSGPVAVADQDIPEPTLINGLPSYALDKHTLAGKRAIHELAKVGAKTACALRSHVHPTFHAAVTEIAAFYADAAPVSQKLFWSRSEELEQQGISADMRIAGCPTAGINSVLDAVASDLEQLNRLRLRSSAGSDGSKKGL